MSKINAMLLKLMFQRDKSHDLNMVYCHVQLSENSSNMCTIVCPWGNSIKRIDQW